MTARLDKLFELIPQCDVLADVGCDHGYVGLHALSSGKARKVLFVDVSEPSLDKARANCAKELLPRAQFVCRDGLGDLKADCAVIAGMGGLEIISILSNAIFPPPCLVLQPNRNVRDVRRYLVQSYRIESDAMMYESGIFYNMITATHSSSPTTLTALEEEFGKNLISPGEDFRLYLDREQAKLTKILEGCSDRTVSERLKLVRQALSVIGGQQ